MEESERPNASHLYVSEYAATIAAASVIYAIQRPANCIYALTVAAVAGALAIWQFIVWRRGRGSAPSP